MMFVGAPTGSPADPSQLLRLVVALAWIVVASIDHDYVVWRIGEQTGG